MYWAVPRTLMIELTERESKLCSQGGCLVVFSGRSTFTIVSNGKHMYKAIFAREKVTNPLFERRPKQFGIGGALPPKKDLTRYINWPKAIRLRRQKRILKQRLKVPPALNQFSKTLDKNLATNLFKILLKYRPEDKDAKKERLVKKAQAETEGKQSESKKPTVVLYCLNHVTYLIE